MSATGNKIHVDTGPPGSRATPLPTRGAGIGARPSTRYILRGEGNRAYQIAQRCRAVLHRTGTVTFASPLNLEDDEPCRVEVTFHGQQLEINLCSLSHLSWTRGILEPAVSPDFSGHLSWGTRRYLVGVHVLYKPELCLGMFLRPLHLHRATNPQPQLEEVKGFPE
jgi:hypothetical protein